MWDAPEIAFAVFFGMMMIVLVIVGIAGCAGW
jgi:hypothetical protein